MTQSLDLSQPDSGAALLAACPDPDIVVNIAGNVAELDRGAARIDVASILRPQGLRQHRCRAPAAPEAVANLVAFLASDPARYVSGTMVTADGGLAYRASVMPELRGAD